MDIANVCMQVVRQVEELPAESVAITGSHIVRAAAMLGAGIAIVNGTCAPRGRVVLRPMRELPKARYYAFTREGARADATLLRRSLATHGDAWRKR